MPFIDAFLYHSDSIWLYSVITFLYIFHCKWWNPPFLLWRMVHRKHSIQCYFITLTTASPLTVCPFIQCIRAIWTYCRNANWNFPLVLLHFKKHPTGKTWGGVYFQASTGKKRALADTTVTTGVTKSTMTGIQQVLLPKRPCKSFIPILRIKP